VTLTFDVVPQKSIGFVPLSGYTLMQNFIELSAAVHELYCVRRKTSNENMTVRRQLHTYGNWTHCTLTQQLPRAQGFLHITAAFTINTHGNGGIQHAQRRGLHYRMFSRRKTADTFSMWHGIDLIIFNGPIHRHCHKICLCFKTMGLIYKTS